jgi:threonine aldolase
MRLPAPPSRSFASDNAAGAHPAVIDAIGRVNVGHALAYGDDDATRSCERRFSELFGRDVTTLLTFNGTGANVLALTALVRPGDAVVCADWAHVNVDETGAPERVVGAKLIDVHTPDAKLTAAQVDEQAHALGDFHHAQPAVVSITQSTELGTLYSVDEIGAICEAAHRHGMRVHMDGARIANAVAATGGTIAALRAMTIDAGVDVVSFGGTKNGMLGGEAVVFLDPELGRRGQYVRKTVTQLPSKMRFIAAQFNALLTDGLWLELAGHANRMAEALHTAATAIDGIDAGPAPTVNSLFPRIPAAAIAPLQAWSFFWDWDRSVDQVRWMTAWDTTDDDVRTFVGGVEEIVASCN